MPIPRNVQHFILSDLEQHDQMLFVSGPRQCGKTTLAEMILDKVGIGHYWNYDIPEDQILLARKPSFFEEIDRKKGVKPLKTGSEFSKISFWPF